MLVIPRKPPIICDLTRPAPGPRGANSRALIAFSVAHTTYWMWQACGVTLDRMWTGSRTSSAMAVGSPPEFPQAGRQLPAPAQRVTLFQHSVRPSRRTPGFTLIEILVVIVVIAILATLVAPNVFRHIGTAKDATARSQIEMLGAALDGYRLDNGRYPTSDQGLEALWREPPVGARPRNWRGPYLRKEVPLDPWGNAYVYRAPGDENPWGYDLISYGEDGQRGGEGAAAEITSWGQ